MRRKHKIRGLWLVPHLDHSFSHHGIGTFFSGSASGSFFFVPWYWDSADNVLIFSSIPMNFFFLVFRVARHERPAFHRRVPLFRCEHLNSISAKHFSVGSSYWDSRDPLSLEKCVCLSVCLREISSHKMVLKPKKATTRWEKHEIRGLWLENVFIEVMKDFGSKSYDRDNETFPIPLTYVDVMTDIQTSFNDISEHKINDLWTEVKGVTLSDERIGTPRFQILRTRFLEWCKWIFGRFTQIQRSTRQGSMRLEVCVIFDRNNRKRCCMMGRKNQIASSNPQQRNQRCIDQWQRSLTGGCWRSSEIGKRLCKEVAEQSTKRISGENSCINHLFIHHRQK